MSKPQPLPDPKPKKQQPPAFEAALADRDVRKLDERISSAAGTLLKLKTERAALINGLSEEARATFDRMYDGPAAVVESDE